MLLSRKKTVLGNDPVLVTRSDGLSEGAFLGATESFLSLAPPSESLYGKPGAPRREFGVANYSAAHFLRVKRNTKKMGSVGEAF
jgi:hypothetical protein